MKLEAWVKPSRAYVYVAFLPVVVAAVTLAALYVYQGDAERRRDEWQKPEALFDALELRPGMSAGQWEPRDTYFLTRLRGRVGPSGRVVRVRPGENAPVDLDAVLFESRGSLAEDGSALESALASARGFLKPSGRLGLIGARRAGASFIPSAEAAKVAERAGFRLVSEESFVERQFILVLGIP